MTRGDKYYVYRRNDNHVFAVCYPVRDYKTSKGDSVTFELLRVFDDWTGDVVDFINAERDKNF